MTSSARLSWPVLLLPIVLLLAFGLRVWNIEQQGWGADYYSAAVSSMLSSWHNLLFVAFDSAGFISVDKPPLALWLQAGSAMIFGFEPKALLWPQALMGVGIVWVVWRIVIRAFDGPIALVAAWLMAVTPVLVAVNRSNNTDTCLLLILLLASWSLLIALERTDRRHFVLALVLLGLAFNTKMLAGLLLLPLFVLMYLVAAPLGPKQRLTNLLLGLVVLLLVIMPWLTLVELTDPSQRPYVGSSRDNSAIELVVGHNARNRLHMLRPAGAGLRDTNARQGSNTSAPSAAVNTQTENSADGQAGESRTLRVTPEPGLDSRATAREVASRLFVRTPAGMTRLLSGQPAAQVAWMLPLVFFGIALAVLALRKGSVIGDVHSQTARWSRHGSEQGLAQRRQKLLLVWFTGWLLTYTIIYSQLGGIVHFYYFSTLAPAVAVLAAVAIGKLWSQQATQPNRRWLGPLVFVVTLAWQFWVQYSAMGWSEARAFWTQREVWLNTVHAAVLLAGVLVLFWPWLLVRATGPWFRGVAATVLLAGVSLLPITWSLSTVVVPSSGILPSADLYRWQAATRDPFAFSALRFGKGPQVERLSDFLVREQRSETYLLSTSTTQWAAPIILRTGKAVMARGGYHGLDAATDVPRLKVLVERGRVRYLLLDDVSNISRRLGADAAGLAVSEWIRANGRVVDPALWRDAGMRNPPTLYDMQPAP